MGCGFGKSTPTQAIEESPTEEQPTCKDEEEEEECYSVPEDGWEQLKKESSQSCVEDIRDKYIIGNLLGSGSFGQVREASLRAPSRGGTHHQPRAVKIIQHDGKEGEWSSLAMFKTEVGLLQTIDSSYIIKYYDFYEDVFFLYVVMEKCDGGEVFQKIRELQRFGEVEASKIGKQMLLAIEYIHRLHVAHRDIKAENYLFLTTAPDSTLKMIDFGMATTVAPGEWLTVLCGSPHYLSPELIGQKYNHMTDIWAFGVLMYLMLFGHYPHEGKRSEDIMWKVLSENINWKSSKVALSNAAISFLGKVLEPRWDLRLTAEKALLDPWILGKFETMKPLENIPSQIREAAHSASKMRFGNQNAKAELEKKLEQINQSYTKGSYRGIKVTGLVSAAEKDQRHNRKMISAPGGNMAQAAQQAQMAKNQKSKLMTPMTIGEEDDEEEDDDGGDQFHQPVQVSCSNPGTDMAPVIAPEMSRIGGITREVSQQFASKYTDLFENTASKFTLGEKKEIPYSSLSMIVKPNQPMSHMRLSSKEKQQFTSVLPNIPQ